MSRAIPGAVALRALASVGRPIPPELTAWAGFRSRAGAAACAGPGKDAPGIVGHAGLPRRR